MSLASVKWFDFKAKRKIQRAKEGILKELEVLKSRPETQKRADRIRVLKTKLQKTLPSE